MNIKQWIEARATSEQDKLDGLDYLREETDSAYEEGYSIGLSDGYDDGYAEGYDFGFADASDVEDPLR